MVFNRFMWISAAILLSVFFRSYAVASLLDGLVTYYQYEGNLLDSSPSGNNASGTSLTFAAGLNGTAAVFGDGSQAIAGPAINSSTSFTVSSRVRPTSIRVPQPMIIVDERNVSGYGSCSSPLVPYPVSCADFQLSIYDGKFAFSISTFSVGQSIATQTRIFSNDFVQANQDYSVIARYDSGVGEISLWVDGQLEAQASVGSDLLIQPDTVLRIGRSTASADQGWIGMIDETRIYSRPLSSDEISELATLGANQPPQANAGTGQTVHAGSAVSLDGSLSTDPDGNYPLGYDWSIVSAPSGSSASLNNPAIVNPSFMADLPGNYVFQLAVTDSKGMPSTPSRVVISTINTPPVADAGTDQFATVIGSTVTLDGSGSYDNDGDDITYQWRIVSAPGGSSATLSDATAIKPTFTADVHGDYVIELSVRDFWSSSTTSRTMVGFNNINPVAISGLNQSATIGDTIYLDGSGSYDANGDHLTYLWTIVGRPPGSQATLSTPNESQSSFTPDLPGQYVLNLVVNDGLVDSTVSVVNISIISVQDVTTAILQRAISTINNIQLDLFNNNNNRNALTNKINAVLTNIESGNYEDALSQLANDVLGKTDGCATTGKPDKNDWITVKDKNPTVDEIRSACQAQGEAYSIITQAIGYLESLL